MITLTVPTVISPKTEKTVTIGCLSKIIFGEIPKYGVAGLLD